jgi:hypothetical protein
MTAAMNDLLVVVSDMAVENDLEQVCVSDLHAFRNALIAWRNSSCTELSAAAITRFNGIIKRFESTLSKLDKLTGRGYNPEPEAAAESPPVSEP